MLFGLIILILTDLVSSLDECHCGIHQVDEDFPNHSLVGPGMYPWLVKLELQVTPFMSLMSEKRKCLGVIVSPNFVLTTSYCAQFPHMQSNKFHVQTGDMFFKKSLWRRAEKITLDNPPLARTGLLGLIRLENPLSFSEKVKPICLTDDPDLENAEKIVLVGFDRGFENVKQTNVDRASFDDIRKNKTLTDQSNDEYREYLGLFFKRDGRWYLGGLSSYSKIEPARFPINMTLLEEEDQSKIELYKFDPWQFNDELKSCSR